VVGPANSWKGARAVTKRWRVAHDGRASRR
jgi:hypothetical protein